MKETVCISQKLMLFWSWTIQINIHWNHCTKSSYFQAFKTSTYQDSAKNISLFMIFSLFPLSTSGQKRSTTLIWMGPCFEVYFKDSWPRRAEGKGQQCRIYILHCFIDMLSESSRGRQRYSCTRKFYIFAYNAWQREFVLYSHYPERGIIIPMKFFLSQYKQFLI